MPGLIDMALEDFPRSEIWRLQTDGWQAVKGPLNFRPAFYKGMESGFAYLRQHDREKITPQLIEEIYHTFYRYEDAYIDDEFVREGYNTYLGEFEIFLPEPGLEEQAGVSDAGISELIRSLKASALNKGERKVPFMQIKIERFGTFALFPDVFSDTFEADLRQHLLSASVCKDAYTGTKPKPDMKTLVKVLIASNPAEREEIIQMVQNDIDNYYQELKEAKSIPHKGERQLAEINAINHFIRKLHQSHYFPDGNGRTFVFLLANMLLLQNGFGMKIINTPSHFAAFSSEELAQETLSDLSNFQAYKITAGKNYLTRLTAKQINTEKKEIKNNLLHHLNPNPLIAMAQINELFRLIKDHDIHVPKGYNPKQFALLTFLSGDEKSKNAHTTILNQLKEMYLEQLNLHIQVASNEYQHKKIDFDPVQALMDILKTHEISHFVDEKVIKVAVDAYQDVVRSTGKQELTT